MCIRDSATGVSMLFFWRILQSKDLPSMMKLGLLGIVSIYYLTLVVGRVYCGMHGMLDLISGSAVGAICFLSRILIGHIFRNFQSAEYLWFPIISIAWGLFILFYHIRPVDECPCFEDSVAFIGVVSGFECSDWILQKLNSDLMHCTKYSIMGSFIFLRPFLGVACVTLWKSVVSKPLVYNFLTQILHLHDDRKEKQLQHDKVKDHIECPLYIGEAKLDIVGRFFIYAGIPFTVILICPIIFSLFHVM